MNSYKSDAIDIMAKEIEKRTKVSTPAGQQLEIDQTAVEGVMKDVVVDTPSVDQTNVSNDDATDSAECVSISKQEGE